MAPLANAPGSIGCLSYPLSTQSVLSSAKQYGVPIQSLPGWDKCRRNIISGISFKWSDLLQPHSISPNRLIFDSIQILRWHDERHKSPEIDSRKLNFRPFWHRSGPSAKWRGARWACCLTFEDRIDADVARGGRRRKMV
jgi:hypothetical protein